MKTISILLASIVFWGAIVFSACGPSKAELQQAHLDSLRTDSIKRVMQKLRIDTCTAYFRRHTLADGIHTVTFDRIELLSDSAAYEYAKNRHGFEGKKNIVINLETTTATMSMSQQTDIWIVNPDFKTGKSDVEYIKGTVSDVIKFGYNTIITIVTQDKNILWLKQMNIEE